MPNSNPYQVADPQVFESLMESSANPEMDSSDLWGDLDLTTSPDSDLLKSPQPTPTARLPKQSPLTGQSGQNQMQTSFRPKLPKTASMSKKRKCQDTKGAGSQDLSALNTSDYWLRFDSDTESLFPGADGCERDTEMTVNLSDLIQPYNRTSAAGTSGNFNQTFQSSSSTGNNNSAFDSALPDDEDLLMALTEQTTITSESSPGGIEAQDQTQTTPMTWNPQHGQGIHLDTAYFSLNPLFCDPERQRLLAIALGTGQAPNKAPKTADFDFDFNESPMTTRPFNGTFGDRGPEQAPTRPESIRTDSANSVLQPKEKPKASDRAAHNDIERKYRTNLKDRISELREAIPSLRSAQIEGEGGSKARSGPKVSKGQILSKATEYIHQLERRSISMTQKNEELTRRLQAFEQLVGAGPPNPNPTQNWPPQNFPFS